MDHSDQIARYLRPQTQAAYAASKKPKTENAVADDPLLDPESRTILFAAYGPSLLARDTQARIHNLIFGSSIKTLDEAKRLHQLLIDSIEEDTNAAKKRTSGALFDAIGSA